MYTCGARRATVWRLPPREYYTLLNMGERRKVRPHDTTSRSRPRSAARASPRRAPAPTRRRRCRSGCCPCSPGGGGRACSALPWLLSDGPREVAKASRGRAAAMAPLRSDGGGRSVAATKANLAGVPTTGQRANHRARGTGRDPAHRSRIIPRAGATFQPPFPPPRYRPPPSIALWARARDGNPALDAGSCRRPSRRRAW